MSITRLGRVWWWLHGRLLVDLKILRLISLLLYIGWLIRDSFIYMWIFLIYWFLMSWFIWSYSYWLLVVLLDGALSLKRIWVFSDFWLLSGYIMIWWYINLFFRWMNWWSCMDLVDIWWFGDVMWLLWVYDDLVVYTLIFRWERHRETRFTKTRDHASRRCIHIYSLPMRQLAPV